MTFLGNIEPNTSRSRIVPIDLVGDGVTVSFPLGYVVPSKSCLLVDISGSSQHQSSFDLNYNGTSIVFTEAPPSESTIEVKIVIDLDYNLIPAPGTVNFNTMDSEFARKILRGNKNKIINGNFDFWQRGTTSTVSGNLLADRWIVASAGSTFTASQQLMDQSGLSLIPGLPNYFMRVAVSSVVGSGNYTAFQQRIEGVNTLSGKNATLSFWARADSNRNIAIDILQYFGTGGAPSTSYVAIPANNKIALSNVWQKFTMTVVIPNNSSKSIGTSGNDYLAVRFFLDADNSIYGANTNNLGQQSGTFDVARVQFEEGDIATDFEDRSIGHELLLCQRYYEKSYDLTIPPANINGGNTNGFGMETSILTSTSFRYTCHFKVVKRDIPTITIYNSGTGATSSARGDNNTDLPVTTIYNNTISFTVTNGNSGGTNGMPYQFHWTSDAEL